MWDIVLVVCAVLLFILVVLQIIYIRSALATYEKEKYKILNGGNTTLGSVNNTLKVYGLDIHKKHTTLINDATRFTPGFDIAIPDNLYVYCSGIPMSKDVLFKRGTWLVLNRNEGSNNLIQDVLSKRTRYIIIDNVMHVIHFDRELVEKLRESLDTNSYVDKTLLSDQEFIYITKVDNTFDFADSMDSARCTPLSSMRVFKLQPSSSSSDIITQIHFASADLPLVIVGFSTV